MREFWEKQAEQYKSDVTAVNFDPLMEDLEQHHIPEFVHNGEVICDVGCGNGRTLLVLAKIYPDCRFFGVDYIQGMIDAANVQKNEQKADNVTFLCADASTLDLKALCGRSFDKVLTKRLLINLKGEQKFSAIRSIHRGLKDGGVYVMTECFISPLARVNVLRKQLGLEEIKVKDFNEYLSDEDLVRIQEFFQVERTVDFSSLYYFISRLFNARLASGVVEYKTPLNALAVELTKMGCQAVTGYGPEIMYVLKKR